MRSWGKILLCLVTATTLFVSLCEPAEARRRFHFGFMPHFGGGGGSYSEKIERVYELPNTDIYFRDGKHYDLGNFYRERDGSAERGPAPIFVLYNGDSYVRLSDEQLAIITADLGHDPTAAFRAEYAAKYPVAPRTMGPNEIERREGESIDELRARARAMAKERGEPVDPAVASQRAVKRGTIGAVSYLPLLLIGGVALFVGRKLLRGPLAAALAPSEDSELDAADTRSFDQRVAQRLREVGEQGGAPEPAPPPGPPPASVRTFGRRTA